MYFENGFAFVQIRQIDVYLTVETPCAEQRLVQYVCAVGCCQHYHVRVGLEAVHFGEQLVEGILAFVVRACHGVFAASPAYRIYFVDEYYRRGFFLSLFEKVAYTRSADTDEHFHEIRP